MVELDMDNSGCSKTVEFYQLSLIRTIRNKQVKDSSHPKMNFNIYAKETIMATRKFDGLAKNSFETKFLNIEIPKEEEKNFTEGTDEVDGQLLRELTPTFDGKFFSVSYDIVLAIKHSSWE